MRGRCDPKAPVAKRVPRVETRHGREFRDDYAWLRDRSDPDVMAYLEAENAYTEAVMRPTAALQERLYGEILGRIRETDCSVPEPDGPYRYFERTEEGKPYAIHLRRRGEDGPEELLLDENELAGDLDYFRLGAFEISPDHRLLAYAFDADGSESFTLRFKDLESGELLPDVIPGTYATVEWAADSRTVFYNTFDAAHRPHRLYRHVLGDDPQRDVLVHEESDEAFFLGLYKTRSRRYLILHADSNTTSEARFLDAADPAGRFRTIWPRRSNVEYAVEHHGDGFLILNNDRAVNFKLVETSVDDPTRVRREILPHRPEVKLDGVQPFADHLVVAERQDGLRGIRVIRVADGEQQRVAFPEPVYSVRLHRNPEFESSTVRFSYTSLVTPDSVIDYDMRSGERTVRKQLEVVGGYDPARYASERIHAIAPDGTRVPISLVYRRDLRRNGPGPMLLYGYGSYGISVDPTFDSGRLSLLDRGVTFAIAHVRGGGELGRPWYDGGKLQRKKNSFTDFIACAERLIDDGLTSAERLAISGTSAGGLLVGAATTMRPELFAVTVAKVPFLDVVNTMLDASIPLTVIEWEEWGNPNEEAAHETMLAYSPYDNIRPVAYGDMLVLAGLNDPRVAYWEPAKWTARLRALKTDDNVLLLKTHLGAGHGGLSGRYPRIRELAFEYAFILTRLGLEGGA